MVAESKSQGKRVGEWAIRWIQQ